MLQEQLVNLHFVPGFGFDFRYPGKETLLVFLAVQRVTKVAEIHLKRRVGDDVVKAFQRAAVLVERMQNSVALDNVRDRMHQVVEDQVQTQQAGGFLRDILGKDAATIFPNGVRHVHQQRAGTGGRVVTAYVAHHALLRFRHQDFRHDARHGVGRVVFRVFAAGVAVVVFDQVFKDGGVEVEFLREDAFEAEIGQLVDDGAAEIIAL
ncbi:hypothetical protein HmCmsJML189_01946 [Escherichia coli]|nr:hypothetical protein HmCmsJML189_01946 [Escherichia coli]